MLSSKANQQELDAESQRPLLSSSTPTSNTAPSSSSSSSYSLDPTDPSLTTHAHPISSSSPHSCAAPSSSSFSDSLSLKELSNSTSTSSVNRPEAGTESPRSSNLSRFALSSSTEHVCVDSQLFSSVDHNENSVEDARQWSELNVFTGVSGGRKGGDSIFRNLKRPRRIVRNMLIFGFRGTENFLVYLWIFKDLAWTQTWVRIYRKKNHLFRML